MATASIFMTTSSLLTCVALVLGLLPPCTHARSFPFPPANNIMFSTTDLLKKTPKSPPSPKHQATNGEPAKQAPGSVLQLQSTTVFNFGKTPSRDHHRRNIKERWSSGRDKVGRLLHIFSLTPWRVVLGRQQDHHHLLSRHRPKVMRCNNEHHLKIFKWLRFNLY
ncbi:hypothetical protein GQ457_01G024460 [Hibiscus cannabinus]